MAQATQPAQDTPLAVLQNMDPSAKFDFIVSMTDESLLSFAPDIEERKKVIKQMVSIMMDAELDLAIGIDTTKKAISRVQEELGAADNHELEATKKMFGKRIQELQARVEVLELQLEANRRHGCLDAEKKNLQRELSQLEKEVAAQEAKQNTANHRYNELLGMRVHLHLNLTPLRSARPASGVYLTPISTGSPNNDVSPTLGMKKFSDMHGKDEE